MARKKSATEIKIGPYSAWQWQNPKFIRLEMDSSDGENVYAVFIVRGIVMCQCPGFKFRGTCRHAKMIEMELGK